jgi:hypothetical protein
VRLLDRIHECNIWSQADFIPFEIGSQRVGWLRRSELHRLDPWREVFDFTPQAVTLSPDLADCTSRTAALEDVARGLYEGGAFSHWRDEPYPVLALPEEPSEIPDFLAEPLALIERSAVRFFGLHAWGIHLNGFTRKSDGLHIWLQRRGMDRPLHPGLLDNLVAGGQPAGIPVADNLLKEAMEEAGLGAQIMAKAQARGTLSYCVDTFEGLSPATMILYDIELDGQTIPRPVDGEVAEFLLWPVEKVVAAMESGSEVKPNTHLAMIDFLLRHNLLETDDTGVIALRKALGR